jgi:hypothetical protein
MQCIRIAIYILKQQYLKSFDIIDSMNFFSTNKCMIQFENVILFDAVVEM